MLDSLVIQSHKGSYTVSFNSKLFEDEVYRKDVNVHFIVDANVAKIHEEKLQQVLDNPKTIIIEAVERSKSLENIIPIIDCLVKNNVRRNHRLIAIGGGVTQDITCFISSTLLRGVEWEFVPTTLLSQADSCIGSKSSININSAKNILGTFHPPRNIYIDFDFLDTLESRDVRSGIGEIIKVHAIESSSSFDQLSDDYNRFIDNKDILQTYIRSALAIKKRYIEKDEFDKGIRNVFNYGHSFGHAIEAATRFEIPHGVAVTIGMDMANHIAMQRGLITEENYRRMNPVLVKNYSEYINTEIPIKELLSALLKDKKNTNTHLVLILPLGDEAKISRVEVCPDDEFSKQCSIFLEGRLNEE